MNKDDWNLLKIHINNWQGEDGTISGFKEKFPRIYEKIEESGIMKPNYNKSIEPDIKFISIYFSPDDTILVVFRDIPKKQRNPLDFI